MGVNEIFLVFYGEFKFEDFILYLIDIYLIRGKIDEYWNYYDNFCYLCEIDFDFIGKYEILIEDVLFVLCEVGVDYLVLFFFVCYILIRNSLGDYYFKVLWEDIMWVKKFYCCDFEMFGYNVKNFLGSIIK